MINIKTEKDLYNYIDSLKKEPGEFTLDEMSYIGYLHKKLPLKQKSWKKLAKRLGYPGSENAYRCFVNSTLRSESEIEKIAESKSEDEEYQTMYKEKTQIRDIYNAYRASLRNTARIDSFKETLFSAVKNLKPLNFSTRYVNVNGDEEPEAILMFSDLHLGAWCDNFYNKYNMGVAKSRLEKLATDTIMYCKLFGVKRLNFINLGDLIHGNIHVNARITQEFNLVDQIIKASELTCNLLAEFSKSGLDVTYRSCTDNHSRATASKEENIEEENFNRLIDWYISARLEGSNIKIINDNIDASLGKFKLLNGKNVMFAHGHLENPNKCIDAFNGATREFIDYVLLSHFHNSREKSYNGSRLVINGSVVGTEQYALSKRLFSPAEQKLLVFDKDNFLDLNINLQ